MDQEDRDADVIVGQRIAITSPFHHQAPDHLCSRLITSVDWYDVQQHKAPPHHLWIAWRQGGYFPTFMEPRSILPRIPSTRLFEEVCK